MRRAQIAFAALVLAFGLSSIASAQNPPEPQPANPPEQAQPPAAQPQDQGMQAADHQKASGELLSVDPTTKTLTIKTDDGKEQKFAYTDTTEISGAAREAAGLATATGSKVTVEYTGSGDTMTATKIKVQKGKSSSSY